MDLAQPEIHILELLQRKERVSSRDLVRELSISRQAVHKHLQHLEEQKLIQQHGAARATYYTALKSSARIALTESEPSSLSPQAALISNTAIEELIHQLPDVAKEVLGFMLRHARDEAVVKNQAARKVIRVFGDVVSCSSRADARRLLRRIGVTATELVINFERIASVSEGFADEIFCVWAKENPQVTLFPIQMVPQVAATISQALTSRDLQKRLASSIDPNS